eukprot:9331588-Ditylum_brightwellii.AAC.1
MHLAPEQIYGVWCAEDKVYGFRPIGLCVWCIDAVGGPDGVAHPCFCQKCSKVAVLEPGISIYKEEDLALLLPFIDFVFDIVKPLSPSNCGVPRVSLFART